MVNEYAKLLRLKHYIKNILIFLPLFFSGFYTRTEDTLICIVGFFLFCFVTSIIYIFNDISDIEKDKMHDTKRNRPLAAGTISIKSAYLVISILIVFVLGLAVLLYYLGINMYALIFPLIYIIINILYSSGLKNIALLDVVILVFGFLIRLFYGGALIGAEVSNWLYLTVMSGAFYMGFGKRRNELIKNKNTTRPVLQYYNKEFLDKNMYVCLTLTIVFYSMWTVDPIVVSRVANRFLIWTVPLVLLIFFQYSLAIEKDYDGDPVEVVFQNKCLLFMILIYILIIGIIFI